MKNISNSLKWWLLLAATLPMLLSITSSLFVHAPPLRNASTLEGTITRVDIGNKGGGDIIITSGSITTAIHSYDNNFNRSLTSYINKPVIIYFYVDKIFFMDRIELIDVEYEGALLRNDWDVRRRDINSRGFTIGLLALLAVLFVLSLYKIWKYYNHNKETCHELGS